MHLQCSAFYKYTHAKLPAPVLEMPCLLPPAYPFGGIKLRGHDPVLDRETGVHSLPENRFVLAAATAESHLIQQMHKVFVILPATAQHEWKGGIGTANA